VIPFIIYRERKVVWTLSNRLSFHQLSVIKKLFAADAFKDKETQDAASWARADLMLSDALISIFHDIKLGRLPNDSITLRKDSVLLKNLFLPNSMLLLRSFHLM
jgi:hypothetical protein